MFVFIFFKIQILIHVEHTCADPGIFVRGGGGVSRKQHVQRFFFLALNLFYNLQRGSNGFITEKTILFQGSRGGPTFSRGGGSTYFPGGGRD